MNAMREFISRIKKNGKKRRSLVKTVSMGRERIFIAYDIGDDTFIFEKGISHHLSERPSVLVVAKRSLRPRMRTATPGYILTMSSGNHAVAAFPLLDGRFWGLSSLASSVRGDVLMNEILCSNVVDLRLETSQRDVAPKLLYEYDAWLLDKVGFGLDAVVMGDRSNAAIEHYRRLGEEWRVKPLAWREQDIRRALENAKKHIATSLNYYHSSRGVHFLSFSEFKRFADFAQTDPVEFLRGMKELVSVFEGNRYSFCRMPKYRGHHEIEFFGLKRGTALDSLVPEIERLMEAVILGRIGQLGVIQRASEIVALYESLLTRPDLADENSRSFIDTMYMHITGEIYSAVEDGSTPAFDARRTALPGATFVDGRPVMHPGADKRSELLLSNLRGMMSKDERIEYANVYELRDDGDVPIGKGATREIVYKTNRRPLESSMIEKRLSRGGRGYSSYMLSRIGALRSLGVALSDYYLLLKQRPGRSGELSRDFYIRRRCEGESMDAIPANYFSSVDDSSVEEPEVVLGLAMLMGDAAAQNMAMKKYDPATNTPLFGVGKEIYEFEYDIVRQRVVPKRVTTCSIRGSFGWPRLDHSEENIHDMCAFYLLNYAHALKEFQKRHSVDMAALAERFMDGFEFRTHAMEWQLSVMRDKFEEFNPDVPKHFGFEKKWRFVMWALQRQDRRLPILRRMFFEKVKVVEDENTRDNP